MRSEPGAQRSEVSDLLERLLTSLRCVPGSNCPLRLHLMRLTSSEILTFSSDLRICSAVWSQTCSSLG
jgi:hypothetical protein